MGKRKEMKRLKAAFRVCLANAPREWYNRVLQSGYHKDRKKDFTPFFAMFSHPFAFLFFFISTLFEYKFIGVFDFIPPFIRYRYA
jgi:hypothetical protein